MYMFTTVLLVLDCYLIAEGPRGGRPNPLGHCRRRGAGGGAPEPQWAAAAVGPGDVGAVR